MAPLRSILNVYIIHWRTAPPYTREPTRHGTLLTDGHTAFYVCTEWAHTRHGDTCAAHPSPAMTPALGPRRCVPTPTATRRATGRQVPDTRRHERRTCAQLYTREARRPGPRAFVAHVPLATHEHIRDTPAHRPDVRCRSRDEGEDQRCCPYCRRRRASARPPRS